MKQTLGWLDTQDEADFLRFIVPAILHERVGCEVELKVGNVQGYERWMGFAHAAGSLPPLHPLAGERKKQSNPARRKTNKFSIYFVAVYIELSEPAQLCHV